MYKSLKEVLLAYGNQVTPMQLYADMFRIGEGYIQRVEIVVIEANPLGYFRNCWRGKRSLSSFYGR